MTYRTLVLPASALLAGLAIACGGGEPAPAATTPAATETPAAAAPATSTPAAGTPTAASTASPAGTAAPAAAASAEMVAIEEGDRYSYSPNRLTLKAGEVTVKLTNRNGNERPHTLAVKDSTGKDIVRSERVQPGSSLDVKFTVAQEGTYDLYCSLMGHADRGQTGTLTVVKG